MKANPPDGSNFVLISIVFFVILSMASCSRGARQDEKSVRDDSVANQTIHLDGFEVDNETVDFGIHKAATGFPQSLTDYYHDLLVDQKGLFVASYSSEFFVKWVVWALRIEGDVMLGVFRPDQSGSWAGYSGRSSGSNAAIPGCSASFQSIRNRIEMQSRSEGISDTLKAMVDLQIVYGIGDNLHYSVLACEEDKVREVLGDIIGEDSPASQLLREVQIPGK